MQHLCPLEHRMKPRRIENNGFLRCTCFGIILTSTSRGRVHEDSRSFTSPSDDPINALPSFDRTVDHVSGRFAATENRNVLVV